jgi:transposase
MLTSIVLLLYDNARLHTAACTRALREHFNWELFDYPPYSPDLTLSAYLPEELVAITALQQQ